MIKISLDDHLTPVPVEHRRMLDHHIQDYFDPGMVIQEKGPDEYYRLALQAIETELKGPKRIYDVYKRLVEETQICADALGMKSFDPDERGYTPPGC